MSEYGLTTRFFIDMLFVPQFCLEKLHCLQCHYSLISSMWQELPHLGMILLDPSIILVVNLLSEEFSFIFFRGVSMHVQQISIQLTPQSGTKARFSHINTLSSFCGSLLSLFVVTKTGILSLNIMFS